jgi:hypothetical protein
MRFAGRQRFAKKTAPGNSAVANSTSHGTRRAKIDGGVARRMSAPRAPPTRLMTNSLRIVSPVGVPASARPVKPVTSCAGNSATVEVMFAARASMPVSISDGSVMNGAAASERIRHPRPHRGDEEDNESDHRGIRSGLGLARTAGGERFCPRVGRKGKPCSETRR